MGPERVRIARKRRHPGRVLAVFEKVPEKPLVSAIR